MDIKRITLTSLLMLMFSFAKSQQFLDLSQCRDMAIENNKELKMASESIRKAHYDKKVALMKYFPKASASGMYSHFSRDLKLIGSDQLPSQIPLSPEMILPVPDGVKDMIVGAGTIDLSNLSLAGVTITQPIFMGGRIVAYNDIQKYAEELAKSQKDTKLVDVIVETDEAYWQIVSVSNKTKLAESYVKLLSRMDSDMQDMLDEGLVTKADRLSVAVKLNEAEITKTKAENGLALAKMLLCEIIGLDINTDIQLKDENLDPTDTIDDPVLIPSNLDDAVENRSEIKSLTLAEKIYKKQEKIALAEFLPEIGLQLGYYTTKPNVFNGVQNKFSGMWNITVAVSVPLNFITNSAKLNSAKAQTAMRRYQLEDSKEKIKLQINQASFKYDEAKKVLKATNTNVEKANENLRYANDGFNEGVMATSDVLGAHTAWVNAQVEHINAQIDLKLAKVYLNRALGKNIGQ